MVFIDNFRFCYLTLSFRRIGQQRLKIKYVTELKFQILLDNLLDLQIELISLKRYLHHWWQFLKSDKLGCILLAIIISLVLILSIESFFLDVLFETFLDVSIAAHSQLNCVKSVIPTRLVVDIDTLNDVLHVAFKKSIESALYGRVLHLFVKLITKNAIEFIHILLRIDVLSIPAECL